MNLPVNERVKREFGLRVVEEARLRPVSVFGLGGVGLGVLTYNVKQRFFTAIDRELSNRLK